MTSVTRTMKFNHISFPSRDVAATAAFFEHYLGCTATRFGSSQILKRHDFDIVIEDASDRPVDWPGNFHIGFEVPTAVDVEINTREDAAEPFRASFQAPPTSA